MLSSCWAGWPLRISFTFFKCVFIAMSTPAHVPQSEQQCHHTAYVCEAEEFICVWIASALRQHCHLFKSGWRNAQPRGGPFAEAFSTCNCALHYRPIFQLDLHALVGELHKKPDDPTHKEFFSTSMMRFGMDSWQTTIITVRHVFPNAKKIDSSALTGTASGGICRAVSAKLVKKGSPY